MGKIIDSIWAALDNIRVGACEQGKKDKGLAAGPWRTDKPPRDGTEILAHYDDDPDYVVYILWAGKCWWHSGEGDSHSNHDPERWAHVNNPHKAPIT